MTLEKKDFGCWGCRFGTPDNQSCDLSSVGVPSLFPSTPRAGLRCAPSHPLSPVHLLAVIPCNNQILRSFKSPHQLFLLFWWGCKAREAKQSSPVVARPGESPRVHSQSNEESVPQRAPCPLDTGNSVSPGLPQGTHCWSATQEV